MELPGSCDTCQGKLQTKYGTSPRERRKWESIKLKGIGDLNRALRTITKAQNLEFAMPVFSLALVEDFLPMQTLLPFVRVMYVLCYCTLEVCVLLFYFDFINRGIKLRDCH